jgi:Zn-dependent peptidase ImmA (M78 family)
MSDLERGFKAWAERTSLSFRRELGVPPHGSVDPFALAKYLDARLLTPNEVPNVPADVLQQLLHQDPGGWSAASLIVDGRALIIYNPKHSKGRTASDIAHELAHLILDHKPGTVIMSQDGSMVMRSYDRKQEEEANWLGWCILLPREALLWASRMRLSVSKIAEVYGVSETLVTFRMGVTGVGSRFRGRRMR